MKNSWRYRGHRDVEHIPGIFRHSASGRAEGQVSTPQLVTQKWDRQGGSAARDQHGQCWDGDVGSSGGRRAEDSGRLGEKDHVKWMRGETRFDVRN